MEPLLYLTHRIPFPPNKGDKLRSFNLLKYLAARYRVHLGTFVDNPDDRAQVSRVAEYCASIKVAEIQPAIARLRSLSGLVSGEPLTLGYYRDSALAAWVRTVIREQGIGKVVVFSSAMAQYVTGIPGLRVVVDFVDVDSAKWGQYALSRRWPLSAIFERERDHLLAFERAVARGTDASVFVTPAEAELFRKLAPECASRVCCAQNGISSFHVDQRSLLGAAVGITAPGGVVLFSTYAESFWPHRLEWFRAQSAAGLIGEIDEDATGDGVITCKDGFSATTVSPEELSCLAVGLGWKRVIRTVDDSSVFCEITV